MRDLSTQAGHGDIKAALSLMEKMSGRKIGGANGDGEPAVSRPRAGKEKAAVDSRFKLVAEAMDAEQSGARQSAVTAAVGAAKGSTILTTSDVRRPPGGASKSVKYAAKKSAGKKSAAKKSGGKKAVAKKSGGKLRV